MSFRFDTMPSSPILQACAKDGRAVAFQMLVEAQAKANFGQHTSKRGLAHFQRITPHVVAIQLDQVEGVEKNAFGTLAGNNPKAIVLNLVQPQAAGRRFVGFGGKARRDETGRESTLQTSEELIWPEKIVCGHSDHDDDAIGATPSRP
jgi:hypothetical protein